MLTYQATLVVELYKAWTQMQIGEFRRLGYYSGSGFMQGSRESECVYILKEIEVGSIMMDTPWEEQW